MDNLANYTTDEKKFDMVAAGENRPCIIGRKVRHQMEVFIFYSKAVSQIEPGDIQALHPGAHFEQDQSGQMAFYRLHWHDLSIELSVMPADFMPAHLFQLAGDIKRSSKPGNERHALSLIKRLDQTQLVLTVQIEPGLDGEGRAKLVLARLAVGLDPIILTVGALFNQRFQLLLAPDGSFDPQAGF